VALTQVTLSDLHGRTPSERMRGYMLLSTYRLLPLHTASHGLGAGNDVNHSPKIRHLPAISAVCFELEKIGCLVTRVYRRTATSLTNNFEHTYR